MFAVQKIWNILKSSNIRPFMRKYSSEKYQTVFKTEYTVIPFCQLNINGNFHLNIIPLDVHKYVDANKVFINFVSPNSNVDDIPECTVDDNVVVIKGSDSKKINDLICNIEAPVKANVHATTVTGNIHLSSFQGDNIVLKTNTGDMSVENCHCQKIELDSEAGNIICKKVLQASEIYLKTGNFGTITANKLQGLKLIATTVNGHIRTQSTYFNDSSFITETGLIHLLNAHKNCKIHIKMKGQLDLVRFDGVLEAILNEGIANIQLSRIQGDSTIVIEKNGELNLKIFESCQQNIFVEIIGNDIFLKNNLQMTPIEEKKSLILKGENSEGPKVKVQATDSKINIEGATISDLFSRSL